MAVMVFDVVVTAWLNGRVTVNEVGTLPDGDCNNIRIGPVDAAPVCFDIGRTACSADVGIARICGFTEALVAFVVYVTLVAPIVDTLG